MIPIELFKHTNEIQFEESKHSYIVKGERYTSSTTFLKQFYSQFDSEYHSHKKSKEEGVSQEEILSKWKLEASSSTIRGNSIHKYIEDRQNGLIVRPPNRIVIKQYLSLVEFLSKNNITKIFNEFRVYDESLKIAGTMDALYIKDNRFIILDWKTNKKLSIDNPYKNFCKYPFKKVPDTTLGHYYLQINLYRYIITKIVGKDMIEDNHYVIYFPHEGDMEIFEIPNLQKEFSLIGSFL